MSPNAAEPGDASGKSIEAEALRRCELLESGDYAFPARMSRVDLILGVVILVVSLASAWLGFLL